MIGNGTRPAKHLHKVKPYEHFGSIAPIDIPDFDLGRNLPLQDQEKDNAPYECVGYTAAHILSSIFNTPFSPDFSYAAARYVAGDGKEGTQGTSFHAGMDAVVAVGGLQKDLALQTALILTEQNVSDWAIWTAAQKTQALTRVQNGVRNVLGLGDAFDSILSATYQGGIPVSLGSPWFKEWSVNIINGIVQTPILDGNYPSWHDYTADGKTTINGVPYLIIYSHQGNRVGDNGKLYFSRETINAALSVNGAGALTIDTNSVRWVQLIGIIMRRFPELIPELTQLINLK